jgi:glycosyltransferase A (GT-A) superfamily protein (DUF2064 family)
MNAQQQNPKVTLELTMDEVNSIINIIAQAPLPYNTSHHLIQTLGGQVAAQVSMGQAQSATQTAEQQHAPDDAEHTH